MNLYRIILVVLLAGALLYVTMTLTKPVESMREAFDNDSDNEASTKKKGHNEEQNEKHNKKHNSTSGEGKVEAEGESEHEQKTKAKYSNNLLTNGSFTDGHDIQQKNGESGNNKIVIVNNPGSSSYALRQSSFSLNSQRKGLDTYYRLRTHLTPDHHYQLGAWVAYTKEWNGKDNLFNLKFIRHNNVNVIMTNNGRTEKTEKMGRVSNSDVIRPMKWTYQAFNFHVPADTTGEVEIYLGYKPENTLGYRYVTGLSLRDYYPTMPNLPVTQWLQNIIDARHPLSRGQRKDTEWKDLSGNGADYNWKKIPTWNMDGFYETDGNVLVGPPASSLNINSHTNDGNFTILIRFRNTGPALQGVYSEILDVPGNQRSALRVLVPQRYGPLKIEAGGHLIETKQSIITRNRCTIALVCYQNILSLYYNGALLQRDQIPQLYFNHKPILVNPTKEWKADLYNIAIYNQALPSKRIALMGDYLDMMDTQYDDKLDNKDSDMHMFHNSFYQDQGNHNYRVPEGRTYNYEGQKPKQMEVTEIDVISVGGGNKAGTRLSSKQCPKVTLDGLNYLVTIEDGSPMSYEMGYWGTKSYGMDTAGAAKMYRANFPECPLPDILNPEVKHGHGKSCPYVMRENNPCTSHSCNGVNWSDPSRIRKQCAQRISLYCQNNYEHDPKCSCWNPKKKDSDSCRELRRLYEEDNFKCKPGDFPIQDHPNFSEYIKKDNIPCYGCNLSLNQE